MVHLNLSMIHPEQSLFRLSRVIRDIIHEFLRNRIDESSDILFMAKIGSMRDWTKDCSICLEDKIGDSNGWSGHHCQITLFRHCGHSLCTKCNKELITLSALISLISFSTFTVFAVFAVFLTALFAFCRRLLFLDDDSLVVK